MTREQAIKVLEMVEAHGSIVIEAKKMAVEALKAEPCEDAISRQEALEMAVTVGNPNGPDDRMIYVEDIEDLPSVHAESRTGHWEYNSFADEWRCDQCFESNSKKTKYCPNCGARMIEPQESEDKS